MKIYIYFTLIILGLFSCGVNSQYDLDKMGDAVRQHIKYRDIDNNTITRIEILKPVSCEKIPEEKRVKPDEAYLFKVYVQGTWSYMDSYRVYNIDDTLKCYFSNQKVFLRMDEKDNTK